MAKKKISKADKNKVTIVSDRPWDSDFPSQITDEYWVVASCETHQDYPRKFKNMNVGKWLVFADIKEIDTNWQTIKKATKSGLLGIGAKAATAMENPNATSANEKVICIYTYNWQDIKDVYRVEQALRQIGIEHTLYYKTDRDSIDGKYKVRGSTSISKYISKGTKSHKKNALSSLRGVKEEKIEVLKKIGIKNFDDLLSFDTSKKLQGVGVSTDFINKLKLVALSQIEEKIFRLSPFQFHDGDIIHFDIETDLYTPHETRKVWSIAVHHQKKVKHFYAETFKQEKKILKDFINYLQTHPETPMYSFSSFDVSVLKHALKRHKLDVDFFLSRNHFDLCALLKENYILPLSGNGVKEVGKYFGYKFKSEHYDGLLVAMEYLRNERSGKKISKDLINYIQDDVKVMDFIINKIKAHPNIKDIFDHPHDDAQKPLQLTQFLRQAR